MPVCLCIWFLASNDINVELLPFIDRLINSEKLELIPDLLKVRAKSEFSITDVEIRDVVFLEVIVGAPTEIAHITNIVMVKSMNYIHSELNILTQYIHVKINSFMFEKLRIPIVK